VSDFIAPSTALIMEVENIADYYGISFAEAARLMLANLTARSKGMAESWPEPKNVAP